MCNSSIYGTYMCRNNDGTDSYSFGICTFGDSVILICAFFFVGALAGGIGSAMADILTGFAVWAVPTLIIKTIMPIIACAIFGNMKSKFDRCKVISVKGIVGAVVTLLFRH